MKLSKLIDKEVMTTKSRWDLLHPAFCLMTKEYHLEHNDNLGLTSQKPLGIWRTVPQDDCAMPSIR